jgi:phosphoribosylaminoimidazole-succinocarboxamide synthase
MAFPVPIITPATKAPEGHDMDISREEILDTGLVPHEVYMEMEQYTRQLFEMGTRMAHQRGLILADTKYEFGLYRDKVMLIDEVHTPDSSRYFYLDGYAENISKGLPLTHLSKEFVREWLIQQGFQGLDGQSMPQMDNERVELIQTRYFELYERLLGKPFQGSERGEVAQLMEHSILAFLQQLPDWHYKFIFGS